MTMAKRVGITITLLAMLGCLTASYSKSGPSAVPLRLRAVVYEVELEPTQDTLAKLDADQLQAKGNTPLALYPAVAGLGECKLLTLIDHHITSHNEVQIDHTRQVPIQSDGKTFSGYGTEGVDLHVHTRVLDDNKPIQAVIRAKVMPSVSERGAGRTLAIHTALQMTPGQPYVAIQAVPGSASGSGLLAYIIAVQLDRP